MATDQATERLGAIKHIVVLMMENRSFDHMLGYLKRDGMSAVNGLEGNEWNEDAQGRRYPVHELGPDETAFHEPGEPMSKSFDPCHSVQCVKKQMQGGMKGFVRNYAAAKKVKPDKRGLVMGYYTGKHLPVYDFLARQYCVCDSWHSSVPGDTWPNRLYAMSGREAEPAHPKFFDTLAKKFPPFGS